ISSISPSNGVVPDSASSRLSSVHGPPGAAHTSRSGDANVGTSGFGGTRKVDPSVSFASHDAARTPAPPRRAVLDLTFSADEQAFATEARAWLETHLRPVPAFETCGARVRRVQRRAA